jgi:3-dehydroquinate synthase
LIKIIEIKDKASRVIFNCPVKDFGEHIDGRKTILIADENVNRLHGGSFPSCHKKIVIGSGEEVKTLQTVKEIYKDLLRSGADRSSFILAVGGGVVCDIAGFAGSTYMRGVSFAFAPTTLLAQVDAAIGGKNGVNFMGYKNMVGVINQPAFILIDPSFLLTLGRQEISSGYAEVIKCAAIADPSLFRFLEENRRQALRLEKSAIEKIVMDTVKIKISIVERDEKEKGERKKLNFGHTFAHAFERDCGLTHGEAVSAGMVIAASLSLRKGLLGRADFERLRSLLIQFRLPVSFRFQKKAILASIKKDKKKKGETIDFILLKSIGEATIENIIFEELNEVMNDLCEHKD